MIDRYPRVTHSFFPSPKSAAVWFVICHPRNDRRRPVVAPALTTSAPSSPLLTRSVPPRPLDGDDQQESLQPAEEESAAQDRRHTLTSSSQALDHRRHPRDETRALTAAFARLSLPASFVRPECREDALLMSVALSYPVELALMVAGVITFTMALHDRKTLSFPWTDPWTGARLLECLVHHHHLLLHSVELRAILLLDEDWPFHLMRRLGYASCGEPRTMGWEHRVQMIRLRRQERTLLELLAGQTDLVYWAVGRDLRCTRWSGLFSDWDNKFGLRLFPSDTDEAKELHDTLSWHEMRSSRRTVWRL